MEVLPFDTERIIDLTFEVGESGMYKIIASDIESFDNLAKIYLEDMSTETITNLRQTDNYQFYSTPEDEKVRFKLHFIFDAGISQSEVGYKNSPDIYASRNIVYVDLRETIDGEIMVYDLMGQLVASQTGITESLNRLKLNTNPGIYIVKVINSNEIYSEKVFIK